MSRAIGRERIGARPSRQVKTNNNGRRWRYHAHGEETCWLGIVSAFEECISEPVTNHFCIEDEKLFNAVMEFIDDYRQCQKSGSFEPQPDGWRLWKNRKAAIA